MKKIFLILATFVFSISAISQTGVNKPSWTLLGNTTNSLNFLGTTNSQPLVFKTNNTTRFTIGSTGTTTFVNSIISPTVYGSSASGGTLNIFSTSNATKGLIQIGTTGTINIGNAAVNSTPLGVVRIGQGSAYADFGQGNAGDFRIWANQTPAPTTGNYSMLFTTASTRLNAPTDLQFQIGASATPMSITSASTTITNSLNVGVGTFGSSLLHLARFSKGTSTIDIGQIAGAFPGIWMQQNTPTTTNYNIAADGNTTYLNGPASVDILTGGSGRHRFTSTGLMLGSASNPSYPLDVTGAMNCTGGLRFSGSMAFDLNGAALRYGISSAFTSHEHYVSGVLKSTLNSTGLTLVNDLNVGGVTNTGLLRASSTSTTNYVAGAILFGNSAFPATSSVIEIQSTTKGLLFPRMTTVQKNAIASPVAGLVVYDTTLQKLCVYTTAWETITSL